MNYYNPYTPNFGSNSPFQTQQTQVVKVNGEGGARAFQMGANSSALLLDESGVLVWLATTDGAGYKTITPYDISPHKVAPAPDYSTLETRIARLEELMNEYTTNPTAVKRKKPADSDATTA